MPSFLTDLNKTACLSEGCIMGRSSSPGEAGGWRARCAVALCWHRCTATHTQAYTQTVWRTLAVFGLSLMAFSLLCVTVILSSTETLLGITLKCVSWLVYQILHFSSLLWSILKSMHACTRRYKFIRMLE